MPETPEISARPSEGIESQVSAATDPRLQPPPQRVGIACPVCREVFSLALTIEPRVSFGWSGTKGFLTANVGISGIEHVCRRAD